MAFDELGALQRMRQLKQQQASNGKKISLERKMDKIDALIIISMFILIVPTWGIATFFLICFFLWRYQFGKKVYVADIATGEKFYVTRMDWKKYKKDKQKAKKQVRSIH